MAKKTQKPSERELLKRLGLDLDAIEEGRRRLTEEQLERIYRKAPQKRNAQPPLGSGERFRRCVESVAASGRAYDPKAVCAAIGIRKYGARKMAELAARGRRRAAKRNPADDAARAAALSEGFHGRPLQRTREIAELFHERTELADLGRLIELTVWIDQDQKVALQFAGNVRVAASADGGSLYFVGGDQRLDLKQLGLDRHLPKDHVTVGEVEEIVYRTSKAFHDFEPTEYKHAFGEEGGELPVLGYDVHSQKLYLTGGSYQVRPEGIVN